MLSPQHAFKLVSEPSITSSISSVPLNLAAKRPSALEGMLGGEDSVLHMRANL